MHRHCFYSVNIVFGDNDLYAWQVLPKYSQGFIFTTGGMGGGVTVLKSYEVLEYGCGQSS